VNKPTAISPSFPAVSGNLLCSMVMAAFAATLLAQVAHALGPHFADYLGNLGHVHRSWSRTFGGGRCAPVAPALRSLRSFAACAVRSALSSYAGG